MTTTTDPVKDATQAYHKALIAEGKTDEQVVARFRDILGDDLVKKICCPPPDPNKLVTLQEAAEAVGVSRVTIHNWIGAGTLKVKKRLGPKKTKRLVRLGDVLDHPR